MRKYGQPEEKVITFVYDGAEHSTPPRMFHDKREEENLKDEIDRLSTMQQQVAEYQEALYKPQVWNQGSSYYPPPPT